MVGYRFYEEFYRKRQGESMGTVIAIDTATGYSHYSGSYEGAVGVFGQPNSPVCWGGVSPGYLASHCKRISERAARAIHPALFNYLEHN